MPPTAREYLQHILDETRYLGANLPGLDREEFLRNPTLQRAFVRSIEVIGEAAKQIPESLHQQYSIHTLNGARLPVCEIG
jgi:uncharacterized protein with HEPN domain